MKPTKQQRKLFGTRIPLALAQVLLQMVAQEGVTTSEFLYNLIRDEAKRRSLWPPNGNGYS